MLLVRLLRIPQLQRLGQQHNNPPANQNVVKIPELGIQMTVPNDIKDLTYQVSTVMLRNGKQATLAMFSTKALTVLDSNQAD